MSRIDPQLAGSGTTDYERYIRTAELLSLQKDPATLSTHDEAMFQMVHQQAEIWMKLALLELHEVATRIEGGQLELAAVLLHRIARILRILIDGIHVLETMAPWEYHTVRLALGSGSGQDSPGFNRLLTYAPTLWKPFAGALGREGVTLLQLYHDHRQHHGLYGVAEGLSEIDELFQLWRQHHLMLVKRIIGDAVKSLQGAPVENLEYQVKAQLFPQLWQVRNALTAHANEIHKGKGSAARY